MLLLAPFGRSAAIISLRNLRPEARNREQQRRHRDGTSNTSPLPSLTMCLWIQFKTASHGLAWRMAYYFVRGSRPQDLQLFWVKKSDKMTLLVSQGTWNGQSHLV